MQEHIENIATEIISLYQAFGGNDYIGEPVSQIEHMCQAALLAQAEGYDDEVILAAFFHDIGHLCEHIMDTTQMDGFGVVDHEKLGATYLKAKGFSNKITSLVESHVAAKRYLTFKFPSYYQQLSDASKKTLSFQGGIMSEEEAALFEKNPDADLIIRFRHWDEQAKLTEMPLPSLNMFKEKIMQHLILQTL